MINIGKHKNIGKYLSKLGDIIINNIKLMNGLNTKITRTMCDIKNGANITNEKIHKVSVMDNDTLHLIVNDLDETITCLNERLKKSEKRLETIDVYITSCRYQSGNTNKTLGGILTVKITSDNTNKALGGYLRQK